MLKWAVYGKKNNENPSNGLETDSRLAFTNGPYANRSVRRSLDANSIKKSRKPARYQRRSLSSAAIKKSNIKTVDKENVNYAGNTPNCYKEGFASKKPDITNALKDVSNITPTPMTPTTPIYDHKSMDRGSRWYRGNSMDSVPPNLNTTPSTYSRKIREAKKRKLEMVAGVNTKEIITTKVNDLKNEVNKNEENIEKERIPGVGSQEIRSKSLNNSYILDKDIRNSHPISTTRATGDESVEIEFSSQEYVKYRRGMPNEVCEDDKTTLPIFGSRIFLENPLYFNNNESIVECIRPSKRTRKKSNEFESSFKSPTVDKNVHSLIREGFSPISITPLSNKLAALRFSTLRCRSHENKGINTSDFNHNFTKRTNAFSLSMIKDEEISTEMENKFIIPGELTSLETESVSDSQMGDRTLEKMIEDIIKSTKKVKSRRKILQDKHCKISSTVVTEYENKEVVENHMFVKPCKENKTNLIRKARHVNLSRENSMSPKCSPKKQNNSETSNPDFFVKLGISNACNRSFILDDCTEYNEREVKTPENKLTTPPKIVSFGKVSNRKNSVERSKSFSFATLSRENNVSREYDVSSESTRNINLHTQDASKYRLKRQKCVRRKKSTVSFESSWKKRENKPSILTLEMGIPSPYLTEQSEIPCDPLSSSFNCVNGLPNSGDSAIEMKRKSLHNNSTLSNVSHSSMLLNQSSPEKPCSRRPLFGLTLENGIPSPITPVANLKRANKSNLSEEHLHKSCKLDAEYINAADATTPLIEYKTSRRCLTFSPEDASFNSSEEKRRSVASNKSGRSIERIQAIKGTIDLKIVTNNDVVDVHVIRCRDLQRNGGKTDDINAYAKVLISGTNEYQPFGTQRAVFQRTSVLYGRREPEFQRHLKLPLPATIYDHLLIHVSVWHRDKKYRRSEFLGCVSFPLKDAINSDISGCYYLQSQVSSGRIQVASDAHALQEAAQESDKRWGVTGRGDMATDNMDGGNTNDAEKENANDKGIAANGGSLTGAGVTSAHAALQREADEHLFLRYLELDPVEGPESTPTPRRAGSRQGRTPFTSTRRLLRTGTGGFGFTVVWTQPPRVERVAPGGPAERAGVRAGDYLVFVGSKNVVTAPEEQVRQLVHSGGPTLVLETFRRVAQNGLLPSAARQRGSTASHLTSSDLEVITRPLEPLNETYMPSVTASAVPSAPSAVPSAPSGSTVRPGTACSAATSQSLDITAARRKLHLPQVTFSKETMHELYELLSHIQTPAMTQEQQRRRALLAVVAREQHYATSLQFGLVRFVAPLAERSDLITPADHQLLFQNIEEILRLSEDILDQVVHEDGEIQASTVVSVYLQKTPVFLSLYKKYCLGLKRADCVLVKKSRDPSGAFVRFCTSPPLPRRRPDITSLVHKPLEQFRELLRLMRTAAGAGGGNGANATYEHYERKPLQAIADQLQNAYQEVTAGSGLMGLAGDGKPLLSVADLESRLVFTRCKPFVLGTPGRQWIFGGELSRVEGRTVKPYWALLFSDLLLFATVSRDRVLFITEEPVALATVSDACFNVRKKATEFRLTLGRAGGESPLVSCSPRSFHRARSISLRAPSLDLKAVWQSLLQRQIYRVHTMSGTPLGSPLDSPDPQLTFSLATLDSQRQAQNRRNSAEAGGGGGTVGGEGIGGRSKGTGRGASLHLAKWMTQLPEKEECELPDQDVQTWSVEELRKRSKELNLIDVAGIVGDLSGKSHSPHDKNENERSPSKSSSDSQITVRTSPVVVDTIPVCRQCHKKCFSKPNSPLVSQKEQQVTFKVIKETLSPKTSNPCSAQCGNCHKSAKFSKIQRKGAMKILNPKDAPQAALRVIDSIEKYQKRLKSTSYTFGNDSPLLGSRSTSSDAKSPNTNKEKRSPLNSGNSIRSPSPCNSSRNHSPLSTSHTTCSSIVFNSSANDLRTSSPNMAAKVQCVIAQEKYLNEVKCVENVVLSKSKNSLSPSKKDKITRQRAENVLNKVLGMNIITKRENVGGCLRSSSVFLDDDSMHEDENDYKSSPGKSSTLRRKAEVRQANGDVKKVEMKGDLNSTIKGSDPTSEDDLEWGPLMLMGLSAINPTAHLMRVEPSSLRRPRNLESNTTSSDPVPNISVVPPTPDYAGVSNNGDLLDDSPDSPQPEDPPYVTLKRYGTMSSLERMPSDETDDGNPRLQSQENDTDKIFSTQSAGQGAGGGLMGWTARAGSFVVEKMNIFSYTESVPLPAILPNHKQPSFLERYLGVSEWRGGTAPDESGAGEGGDGSGASGEEAWGTPSSGELSDNAFPDSDHGTLSSPTKSSSSYAGDDDTELMMDELLMAPTIAGPTLRPLLPRRRLEPLMEEDYSDSGSEENKITPTATDNQGSMGRGLVADDCCAAPRRTAYVCALEGGSGLGGRGAGAEWVAARGGGGATLLTERSPDITPTNEQPSPRSRSASKDSLEARWGAAGAAGGAGGGMVGAGRRGSGSSASTPSTLERTAIHNPSPSHQDNQTESEPEPEAPPAETERLSPRAEMRLALDQGKDMLADQDARWSRGGGSDPWSWRVACQRSLLRRVASADAVTLCRPPRGPQQHLSHRTALDTTSHSSVYAWKESDKLEELTEMEHLAQVEVRTMRSRTRSQYQNGKIMGFLRRRASSDSPRRTELSSLTSTRPFSPRRTTEKQFEKRFWNQITRRRRSCSSISQV